MARTRDESEALKSALHAFTDDEDKIFFDARWLLSNFPEPIWRCDFSTTTIVTIDFRIRLPDGKLLTDATHDKLLRTIKHWIIAHTNFDAERGRKRVCQSKRTSYLFADIIQIVDYILLNAEALEIHRFGILALTQEDIKILLKKLAGSSRRSNSVYEWPRRLASFLLERIQDSALDYESIIANHGFLATDLPPAVERKTCLSDEALICCRVWLWVNGHFKNGTERRGDAFQHKYTLQTVGLSKLVYPGLLRSSCAKLQLVEFKLIPIVSVKRKFPAVAVRNQVRERVSNKKLQDYCAALRTLRLVGKLDLRVPKSALD